MSATLLLVAALAVIFMAGAAIFRSLAGHRTEETLIAERLGLSWILGAGYVSLATFVAGFLVKGWILIALISGGAIGLFMLARKCRTFPRAAGPRFSLRDWSLLAILIAQAWFILWWAPKVPLGYDALALWEAKAQMAFAHSGALPVEYFSNPAVGWGHVYYPLFLPYTESWLYLWMGRVDQAWVRIIGPITYFAVVGILCGASQRLGVPRSAAWTGAASFFFVPYCITGDWGAFVGYADLPLGVIYLAAASRLPEIGSQGASSAAARLFAVTAGLLPWMKQEGFYLWLILVAIAALQLPEKKVKSIAVLVVPGMLIAAMFKGFLKVVGTAPDPFYRPPTWENISRNADRIIPVFQGIGQELLNFEHWSFLWVGATVALVILLVRRQTRRTGMIFACVVGAPLFLFGWPFVLSMYVPVETHMQLALPRLVFEIAPVAMLVIALALPRRVEQESKERSETR